MKIVADENIPAVAHYFAGAGELILKPGRAIQPADLQDAAVLLVRSVTTVDAALLGGASDTVKFVGSVATGLDHLATSWLDAVGVTWFATLGFNAQAVLEYVIAAFAALQQNAQLPEKKLRIGVIGAGRIGARVIDFFTALGHDVVVNDPLRARAEAAWQSLPLTAFAELDLITLHTPLSFTGEFPTYHLLGKEFYQRQKKGCVLLNTARGAVVNSQELKAYGDHLRWCFDVWENEPALDRQVLTQATLATPHIAGYSLQSKVAGVRMLYDAACAAGIIPDTAVALPAIAPRILSFANRAVTWRDVVLQVFDPRQFTAKLQQPSTQQPQLFDECRKHFTGRYEYHAIVVEAAKLAATDAAILRRLGMTLRC